MTSTRQASTRRSTLMKKASFKLPPLDELSLLGKMLENSKVAPEQRGHHKSHQSSQATRIRSFPDNQRASRVAKRTTSSQQTMHLHDDIINRFRLMVRRVILLLRTTNRSSDAVQPPRQRSHFDVNNHHLLTCQPYSYGPNLYFNPLSFKAPTEELISIDTRAILTMEPSRRTEEQRRTALHCLRSNVPEFSQFPVHMQEAIVRIGWFEMFEPKRVILRKGHPAENFYIVISGKASVTDDCPTGPKILAVLSKGSSFGEHAIMYKTTRTATVTSLSEIELLVMSCEDFVNIFMHVEKNREPRHIQFLRTVSLFDGFALHLVPWDDPDICMITYFRPGYTVCQTSRRSDWIYVVHTGSCRVLAKLQRTAPNIPGLPEGGPPFDYHYRPRRSTGILRRSYVKTAVQPGNRSMLGSSGGAIKPHDDSRTFSIDSKKKASSTRRTASGRQVPLSSDLAGRMHKGAGDVPSGDGSFSLSEARQMPEMGVECWRQDSSRSSNGRRLLTDSMESRPSKPQGYVFVQIHAVTPKCVFGVDDVIFSESNAVDCILMSEGAEVVIISKVFFRQHLTESVARRLRKTLQPYPSLPALQEAMQDKVNWEAYKYYTVNYTVDRIKERKAAWRA
ncbi:hypothetical protein LSAT2_022233 [Lamellibrachia satsuma]|nr:hypothetical protein LSAT2_022233 [Lamellibrachia satsuma]